MALKNPHPSKEEAPPSIFTQESDSRLLKSKIPRKVLVLDDKDNWSGLQCPLRKGIIYYNRRNTVFEHDLYSSSSKHKLRIVAKLQQTSMSNSYQIIPISGNRVLLMGMCHEESYYDSDFWDYLYLSIHEICSYRVGPALWTYHNAYAHSNIYQLRAMKSPTNALGITFGVHSKGHTELFDVCNTGAKEDYPIVEAGRLNYNQQLHGSVELSPDRRILLNADETNETIAIFHSGSADTYNMDLSFVSSVAIPNPGGNDRKGARDRGAPSLAFSADGSKFATATADGVVTVWDVRSRLPLKVFAVEVPRRIELRPISFLRFSSGILGKEVLVFLEDQVSTGLKILHIIDATSFETEETFGLPASKSRYGGSRSLFFETSGRSLYVRVDETLYEWDMRENEGPGCERWLGDERHIDAP